MSRERPQKLSQELNWFFHSMRGIEVVLRSWSLKYKCSVVCLIPRVYYTCSLLSFSLSDRKSPWWYQVLQLYKSSHSTWFEACSWNSQPIALCGPPTEIPSEPQANHPTSTQACQMCTSLSGGRRGSLQVCGAVMFIYSCIWILSLCCQNSVRTHELVC